MEITAAARKLISKLPDAWSVVATRSPDKMYGWRYSVLDGPEVQRLCRLGLLITAHRHGSGRVELVVRPAKSLLEDAPA